MVFTSNTVSSLRSIMEALEQVARNESEVLVGEFGGYQYLLGPESPEAKDWQEALEWCKSLGEGYELPSREVLNQCFMNPHTREQFKKSWYWSSTEFRSDNANAWAQYFYNGGQYGSSKYNGHCVRAVRKVLV